MSDNSEKSETSQRLNRKSSPLFRLGRNSGGVGFLFPDSQERFFRRIHDIGGFFFGSAMFFVLMRAFSVEIQSSTPNQAMVTIVIIFVANVLGGFFFGAFMRFFMRRSQQLMELANGGPVHPNWQPLTWLESVPGLKPDGLFPEPKERRFRRVYDLAGFVFGTMSFFFLISRSLPQIQSESLNGAMFSITLTFVLSVIGGIWFGGTMRWFARTRLNAV